MTNTQCTHPAQTPNNMTSRQDAAARAERCWRLRVRGRTWQECADTEGFRSRRAAQLAVERWLKRNPAGDVETLRRAMGDGIAELRRKLFDGLEKCEERGEYIRVAQLGQVILDSFDKQAKLEGLHIAVPAEVNVNVASFTEVLTDTRSRILAAIEQAPAEVLDAEVVPLEVER